jgi:serine/threonine protein phosphatase PrpC
MHRIGCDEVGGMSSFATSICGFEPKDRGTPMRLDTAGSTNVGMKRDHNEDNLMLLPERDLFVVADGMGGHASGEVASQIAVDTLRDFFEAQAEDEELTWPYKPDGSLSYEENLLVQAVKLANRNIYEKSTSDARFKGMGTTFVGTLWVGETALVAHVGDSRAYCIRGEEIIQLTEDHSLLNDYKKIQKMTPEEEEAFPHKNIIVRALGMKDTVDVDIARHTPAPNDILLLCSDGLNGEISDEAILEIVKTHREDLKDGVQNLISSACDSGGKDNVTVVLIKYLGA